MEFLVLYLPLAATVHAFPQGDANTYQVNSNSIDGNSSSGISDDDIMKLLMSVESPSTTVTAKPRNITPPRPVYSFENNSIADTEGDDGLEMRALFDTFPVRNKPDTNESVTAINQSRAFITSSRVGLPTPQPSLASGGIRYISLNDDHLYVENDTFIDSNRPIFPFQPGDFTYPNSDKATPTTEKQSTTSTKATTTSTGGPTFPFDWGDFNKPPIISPAPEPRQPKTDSRQNAIDNTEEDDDDDDNTTSIQILPVTPTWNESHPCNYPTLEHQIVVEKQGRRVSEIQCEYNMWNYKHKILEAERKRIECETELKKNKELVTGVIGGLAASQGDFPHMGAVGWRAQDNSYTFMCGSSIISSRFAITVAHCSVITEKDRSYLLLASTRPEIVRFGSVYIKNADDPKSKLMFVDKQIDGDLIRLPKYTFLYKYNDIALIRLVSDVEIQANVRPACLWIGHLQNHFVANITGWGQTTKRQGSETSHLRYAELDIIDREECKQNLTGRISAREWWGLVDHQFCAGKPEGGVDSCNGDSGGPLQVQRPLPSNIDKSGIMYYVVGLTSFGSKCAWPYRPGVYVNVSDPNILCWIEKTVWPDEPNSFCPQTLFEGYNLLPKAAG